MSSSPEIVRARIGVIYPDFGDADTEFYEMAGSDIAIHVTRCAGFAPGFDENNVDPIEGLKGHLSEGHLAEAARRFFHLGPDVLAYGCLSCSVAGGPGYSNELCRLLSEWGNCLATTGTTALVSALHALGVSHIAVVSFYDPRVLRMFEQVMASSGISCVNQEQGGINEPSAVIEFFERLGIASGRSQIRSPTVAYHVGKMVDCAEADAVVVTSTGFRTAPMIEKLERDLDKPVVTANQALIWHAMQLAGVQASHPGFGRLFQVRAV